MQHPTTTCALHKIRRSVSELHNNRRITDGIEMGENQDRPCCFAFAFFGAFDLGATLSVAAFFTFGS